MSNDPLSPEDDAVQALVQLGLLPAVPPSASATPGADAAAALDRFTAGPVAPSSAVGPLGLMNPADNAEHVIPPGLMRPTEDEEVAAARAAQDGQPVLPPGLPDHSNPGTKVIPQQLLRPEDVATASQPGAPQSPGQPTSMAPQVPGQRGPVQPLPDLGLEGADQQLVSAEQRANASGVAASRAKLEADNERASHLAAIDATELRDTDRAVGTHQVLRELGEVKAGDETRQWMQKVDDAVKREPDPARMFHGEGGGLRRVLWMGSVMAMAIANRKHPERANTMMQLMLREIDQDVQLQKDTQAKELQGLNMKHQSAQADFARERADLADDRSQRLTRILTVSRSLRDRAMLPGAADQKAGYLAAASAMDQAAAKLAFEYHKEALDSRNKELDRNKDFQLTGIRENAAMQRTRLEEGGKYGRQVQQQKFEVGPEKEAFDARKEGRAFTDKALLAPIEASSKAEAEQHVGESPLNTGLGLHAEDAQGKPTPVVLRKENHTEAGKVIENANKSWMAYNRLDKLLDDVGTSDFVAGSPKLESAKAEIQALLAKDLHGGGRVSESYTKLAQTVATGIAGSWSGRAVQDARGQLDEIKSLVKERIRAMPQEVPNDVRPYTTNNEATLTWTPPDLEGKAQPTPTLRDLKADVGAPTSSTPRPTTVKELDEIEAGTRTAPPLSGAGDAAVKDAAQRFGWGPGTPAGHLPDDIKDLAEHAAANVRKTGHLGNSDAANPEIPKAEREDVARRIDLESQRALNVANEHLRALLDTSGGNTPKLYDFDNFKKAAEKTGGFPSNDPETAAGLRRVYDSIHDAEGDLDTKRLTELLKATQERFR